MYRSIIQEWDGDDQGASSAQVLSARSVQERHVFAPRTLHECSRRHSDDGQRHRNERTRRYRFRTVLQLLDDHCNHTEHAEQNTEPLTWAKLLAQQNSTEDRRDYGMQPCDQCAKAGWKSAIDRNEDSTQIHRVHAHAHHCGNSSLRQGDLGCTGCSCKHGEESRRYRHPDRKKREW